ncbi:MAG: cell envelope integrity protein TolA [Casimicrobiaceae bacterium]
MNADPRSGPRENERLPHRGVALALAVAVHLAFLGVLIFSIRWQSHEPEPVVAELYAPIAQPAKVAPPPKVTPPPKLEPIPTPPPKIEPVAVPTPQPVLQPPKVDSAAADIALKARKDEERRQRVEAEQRAQVEQQKRITELQRQRELQKQQDDKKLADARERQQREMQQIQAQADSEFAARKQAEVAARAQDARKTAESDWVQRIQAKVKGNLILPSDLPGNPQAIFDVVQLPTGEIIDAKLQKSSGVRAYDDAVQRAILKSSPLPKPGRPEMFQRVLTLRFRPND